MLQRHSCIHTGKKPYPCDHVDPETGIACPMEFNYPSQLKKHKNTHEKKNKFFCGFPGCGLSFQIEKELKQHLATNHGLNQKPKCTICSKQPNDLKAHMRTHEITLNPEKVLVCTIGDVPCGRTFNTVSIFIINQ